MSLYSDRTKYKRTDTKVSVLLAFKIHIDKRYKVMYNRVQVNILLSEGCRKRAYRCVDCKRITFWRILVSGAEGAKRKPLISQAKGQNQSTFVPFLLHCVFAMLFLCLTTNKER